MPTIHPRFWDIGYATILIVAIPVAIFHAVQGRWPQAILVTIAAAVGAFLLVTGWNQATAPAGQRDDGRAAHEHPGSSGVRKAEIDRTRDEAGRYLGWIPMGAVSGFVATGIMTAAVLLAYGLSALLASDSSSANQLQVWLAGLIDNTVTEITTVNLALAIAVHLIAGIVWAIIYAGMVEPRVSGTGFQRGVKFGLAPWVLSITVFFPLIGAGFFGSEIGAGPLPVLGNLILHLIYGGALGKVYASHAVWKEAESDVTPENLQVLDVAHRGMAIGLIPGAVLGLLAAVVFTSAFTAETDLLMAGVLGAVVGSAIGVWIGSLAGLSPNATESQDSAGA